MTVFSTIKFWMPLVGLGTLLAFAPQSRAQADVSPDHFDETGIASDFARPKAIPAKSTKPAIPGAPVSAKASGKAKTQTASAKKPGSAQQNQLVAVSDNSKVPPRKRENQ